MTRCSWATGINEAYHDTEWGVPSRDPVHLFELLTLEGAQAGLSWSTVLAKRDGYRRVFAGFDAAAVAAWTDADVERAATDPGIVRHRGKVASVVTNARAVTALGTGFPDVLWSAVDGEPLDGRRLAPSDVPAVTPASTALSRRLKALGFAFVGPTTCYALMQAAGLVNDHLISCFRHSECLSLP